MSILVGAKSELNCFPFMDHRCQVLLELQLFVSTDANDLKLVQDVFDMEVQDLSESCASIGCHVETC